jgi:Xaa-Pro aminopeptidase
MLDRLTLLRQSIRDLNLTAFLISSPSHLRYLFGFTGSNGLGVISSDQAFFVTDWRYREQAKQEVRDAEILIADRNMFSALRERGVLRVGERLGFESHHLSFRMFSYLRTTFSGIKLTATEHVIEKISMRKTSAEIDAIRRAAVIAMRVWDAVLPMIKPGVRESEIAAEMAYRGRRLGADREAFEPIVASGWRSALPHGISSSKKLEMGEMVVIDFGFIVDGYPSDITRTIALGEPDKRLKNAYEVVRQASALAQENIRPEQKAVELDKVVRDFLSAQGLGEAFTHSLGHGLSLDVHGLPRIGPTSKDVIPDGAVVTLEPGVYFSGDETKLPLGGVRIEDDVLVAGSGCEVLTPIPRDLICVV